MQSRTLTRLWAPVGSAAARQCAAVSSKPARAAATAAAPARAAKRPAPAEPTAAKRTRTRAVVEAPPTPQTNYNAELCAALMEMGKIERDRGQMFKFKAYRVAADSLRGLDHRITSGAEASKLPGVGAKIAKKIDDFLATGAISQLTAAKEDPHVCAMQEFNKITGIGPKTAHALYEKGYRTVEELLASGEQFTAHQRIGMKHFRDFQLRIPFDEVCKHAEIVRAATAKVDKRLVVTVCGSFRRRHATSGDIDCLLTHPLSDSESGSEYVYLKKVSEKLRADGFLVDTISEGPKKMMGVSRLPGGGHPARRLDISWFPYDCYWSAVLYFTGSAVFNTVMRGEALRKGMTLNEYGLYKLKPGNVKGEKLAATCEEDIFGHIGMAYVAPEDRNH